MCPILQKSIIIGRIYGQYSAYWIFRLPRQNDFQTFCMSEETEKVYQKLKKLLNYSACTDRLYNIIKNPEI